MRVSSIAAIAGAVGLVAIALGAMSLAGQPSDVQACSIGVGEFEQIRTDSDFAALIDVVQVGGAENSLPPLTPMPTLTPTATPTRGSATPTLDPGIHTADSPTPQPTSTPFDLTGYGATVRVVTSYRGDSGVLQIDSRTREGVEIGVRHQEALPPGVALPCSPGLGAYRWTSGARYVLFARRDGASYEAILNGRFRVIGDEVVLQDESLPPEDRAYLVVSERTYNTYLAGVEAERFEGSTDYHIRTARIPLPSLESMIRNEPAPNEQRPPIVPPITGNAGLKR